jgi:A nuclease family of the HNH/ENDO VII superfamily with conserved AHH
VSNPAQGVTILPGASLDVPAPWRSTVPGYEAQTPAWGDNIVTSNSDLLGQNLEAAGKPKPGDGYQAHHVVPDKAGGSAMQGVRDKLASLGIEIDSAFNGVWLRGSKADRDAPEAYHPRLNNRDYNDAVVNEFKLVTNAEEAIAALQRIAVALRNGTFPGVRPRP